jgi:hypothetical protein
LPLSAAQSTIAGSSVVQRKPRSHRHHLQSSRYLQHRAPSQARLLCTGNPVRTDIISKAVVICSTGHHRGLVCSAQETPFAPTSSPKQSLQRLATILFFQLSLLSYQHVIKFGMDGQGSNPGRSKICHFSAVYRPALGPTQPPIQWVPRAIYQG